MGVEAVSVRVSVCVSVHTRVCSHFQNLKHHWGGGKAALGFVPDQIRTGNG